MGRDFPMVPLGYVATTVAGGTPRTSDSQNWAATGKGISWVAIGDMSGTPVVERTARQVTPKGVEAASLTIGKPGTILFAMYGATVGSVSRLGISAAWNQALLGITPRQRRIDADYLAYALMWLRPSLSNYFRSNTQDNLNAEVVNSLRVPLPPLSTQRAIADYLDRETGEIDGMRADLDEIEWLLRERRTAFNGSKVRQVSTQGIKVSLQSVASIHAGDTITSSEITEHGEYRVYGGNGVRGYCNRANQLEDKVLVGRQGALCGNVHLARGPFYASEHALVVEPRIEVSLNWLTFVLQDQKLGQLSMSAAQPGITASAVGLQRIHIPSLTDQRRIADEIDRETAEVDSMLEDITKLRDLLAERRAALISAAVTGQIDIPVSPTHKDEAHA